MKNYTVIIVEDNAKNRKIMADLLRVHGYSYIEAVDGQEGLELTIEKKPDLVLMDVQLPRLDGYEATKMIKTDERTSHIPVIVVTSFAMKNEENRAREAGCDEYISKPIDIHSFVETIKKFLPKE